jgi:hypothetical protein
MDIHFPPFAMKMMMASGGDFQLKTGSDLLYLCEYPLFSLASEGFLKSILLMNIDG